MSFLVLNNLSYLYIFVIHIFIVYYVYICLYWHSYLYFYYIFIIFIICLLHILYLYCTYYYIFWCAFHNNCIKNLKQNMKHFTKKIIKYKKIVFNSAIYQHLWMRKILYISFFHKLRQQTKIMRMCLFTPKHSSNSRHLEKNFDGLKYKKNATLVELFLLRELGNP